MNDNQKAFESLWSHITGAGRHKPSPCTHAIHRAIRAYLNELDWQHLDDVADRIGKSDCKFEMYNKTLVFKVIGDWNISNADMELWADLSLFGRRDFFPDSWQLISHKIGDALERKRTCQTLERYKANGGLRDEHRKLLAAMSWDLNPWRGDGVSLYVEGKRPFGNSSREHDMIEILGWDAGRDEDGDITEDVKERCWELFDELRFAIKDILQPPQLSTN